MLVYRRDAIPLPNTPHGVQGKRNTLAMTYTAGFTKSMTRVSHSGIQPL